MLFFVNLAQVIGKKLIYLFINIEIYKVKTKKHTAKIQLFFLKTVFLIIANIKRYDIFIILIIPIICLIF
jgi:hypothetical protein